EVYDKEADRRLQIDIGTTCDQPSVVRRHRYTGMPPKPKPPVVRGGKRLGALIFFIPLLLAVIRLQRALVLEVEGRHNHQSPLAREVELGQPRVLESSVPPRLPSAAGDARPFVAIVACIASGVHRTDRFIEEHLLSSIYDTVTPEERRDYRVELILGYDDTDEFWQSHTRELRPRRKHGESGDYAGHEVIPLNFVSIRKDPDGKRPNRIPFNELCQAALEYGADYIARVNDDSEFVTSGWITVATEALRSFSPPNVGVVGPTCRQGNIDIMTHDFVHAPTHISIFGAYYPEVFDNYYLDDWITRVYGTARTRLLANFEVVHHLETFWTRYKATFDQDKLLDEQVAKGGQAVDSYLREKKTAKQRRVLGTDTVEKVDGSGRMGQLHFELKNKRS
ncbi:hypothetical protein THAOC_00083, partial [Thalassiosira oceanica]